ncbi:MAG: type III-B CRISPR module RAMP protein Cmr4 [Anaerolineae bacterium]
MFEETAMLFLTVETPLHAGSGSSLSLVDLPIQREQATGYPMVQSSSLKGALRGEFARSVGQGSVERGNAAPHIVTVFGPDTSQASKHAGAVAIGDARLLLFPVRSLKGVFAWTTTYTVLARLVRDLRAAGIQHSWSPLEVAAEGEAYVSPENHLTTTDGKLMLEEFVFTAMSKPEVATLGTWLTSRIFPATPEYDPWRSWIARRLVVLHDDAFRDFTLFGTEVVSRIRLDPGTKTVARGALWTEEHLPTDSVLYAPVYASAARADAPPDDVKTAANVLAYVDAHLPSRFQLGGDETVGRGLVAAHLLMPGESQNSGTTEDEGGESDV